MPRVKGTPKRHAAAAEHSAKVRHVKHGKRHTINELSELDEAVKKAELRDTISLNTQNQMGAQTWRVKMGQKPNGKIGKIANLIYVYDYEYSDSDKTASEEGERTSSRGGKSRRRKSRKSRKTRKSFYNWS